MRKVLFCMIFAFAICTVSANDGHDDFNTLSIGTGYQYSNMFEALPVSYHGPGITLSNMNSIGNDGAYIYEDILIGFPLSLSYDSEVRNRDRFRSLTAVDASLGAGWAGREGIIRYFFGGGLQFGLLSFSVRCGSLLAMDIGVNAMAGIHVIFTDSLFLECAVKAAYSFIDIQHVTITPRDDWAFSLFNGIGVIGKVAIGIDLG